MNLAPSIWHCLSRVRASLPAACLALISLCWSQALHAHAGSTAYLQGTQTGANIDWRWDLALRDLDDQLTLDANQNGEVTWGEVEQAQQRIWAYASPLLKLQSDTGDCLPAGQQPLQIAEHAGEPYVVLASSYQCQSTPQSLAIDYQALFDVDASHRGLLKLVLAGKTLTAVLTPERRQMQFGAADAPSSGQVFRQYFVEGIWHVWTGYDHILFLSGLFLAAGLVYRSQRWQPAEQLSTTLLQSAKLVTAFTVAHAATLCLAALGVINLPSRWVESAVAATVLFAGLNNLWVMVRPERLFALCIVFGLIHGTAIAGALLDLGLPTTGRVTALLGFNLGVEVAQLALVLLLVPLVFAVRNWGGFVRYVLYPGSALIALAGLVWLVDRVFALELEVPQTWLLGG